MKITREGHRINLTEGKGTISSLSLEANLLFAILEKLEEIRSQNIGTRNHICGAIRLEMEKILTAPPGA